MSLDPKERIVAAAMSCFAAKGFTATTISEIEAAAGLTPGAGGTYRHFASKRAILDAVIDAVVAQKDEVLAPVPTSLKGSVRDGLAQMDRQRDLIRLMCRDLDQFPELLERVADRLLEAPYRLAAERTAAIAPGVDGEAMATIFLGAIVNYKVFETLVGKRPSTVSEERFVAAWAHLYALLIGHDKS